MKSIGLGLLIAFLACGCGDPQRTELQRGIDFAKARFADVSKNPMAAASYASAIEGGGTALNYLVVNIGPQSDLPPYTMGKPEKPWCVVVRQKPGENVVTLEGYGTDLTKPLIVETVTVQPMALD